jgi:hypothetical protein
MQTCFSIQTILPMTSTCKLCNNANAGLIMTKHYLSNIMLSSSETFTFVRCSVFFSGSELTSAAHVSSVIGAAVKRSPTTDGSKVTYLMPNVTANSNITAVSPGSLDISEVQQQSDDPLSSFDDIQRNV